MNHIIPAELRGYPYWIGARKDKKPIAPWITGKDIPVDATDKSNYTDFSRAVEYLDRGECAGLGIGLFPDTDLVGFDLDHCLNEHGQPKKVAKEIIDKLNSYTERSRSKHGFHILCKVKNKDGLSGTRNEKLGIEFYPSSRYFIVTGDALNGYGKLEERDKEVREVLNKYYTKEEKKSTVGEELTDADKELIKLIQGSNNAEKFNKLFNGDWEKDYDSQSSADMALANILAFWTRRNFKQMERLITNSKLGERKKWKDRFDYRRQTISEAIAECEEVYEPVRGKVKVEKEPIAPIGVDGSTLYAMEMTEPDFLIDDTIIRGEVTCITGVSGHKKTFVTLDSAYAVATGGKFLGKYLAKKGKVYYFDDENGAKIIANRLQRYPQMVEEGNFTLFPFSGMDLTEPGWIEWLEKEVTEKGIDYVIIDSFAGVMGKSDQNSANEMRPLSKGLHRLAKEHKVAVVVIHHPRKLENTKYKPDFLESLRGSSELRNVLDSLISLWMPHPRKDDTHVQMYIEKRRDMKIDPEPYAFKLILNDDEHTINFEDASAYEPKLVAAEQHASQLLEYLSNQEKTEFTTKELKEILNLKDSRFYDVTKWAKDEGWLKNPKQGLYEFIRDGGLKS